MNRKRTKTKNTKLADGRLRAAILMMLLLLTTVVCPCAALAARQDFGAINATLRQLDDNDINIAASRYLYERNRPDSALIYYSYLVTRRDGGKHTLDDHGMAAVLFNMGYLYTAHFYDYQKAFYYLNRALELSRQKGLPDVEAYTCANIAAIFSQEMNVSGDLSLADSTIFYLRQSLRITVREGMDALTQRCYINIISEVMENADEKNLQATVSELAGCPLRGNSTMAQYARLLRDGITAYTRGDNARALTAFRHMERLVSHPPRERNTDDSEMKRYLFMARYFQSFAYNKLGQYDMSVRLLTGLADYVRNEHLYDFSVLCYKRLSLTYRKKGDTAAADRALLSCYKARERVLREFKINRLHNMEFLRRLEESNNKTLRLQQRHRTDSIVVGALAVLVMVTVCFLILVKRKNKELEFKNRHLYTYLLDRNTPPPGPAEPKERYSDSRLADTRKETIKSKIADVLAHSDDIYGQEFSLDQLSALVGERYHDVSQVINQAYGKSFYQLLSDARIDEACRRMSDEETYGALTLEAIGQSVGFKSRSNFSTAFKRKTGLSPSEYLRMARQ